MKSNAKRILSFMLAVLLCACMVVPVAADAELTDACETEHVAANGTLVEVVEPVCGNYGYTIYTCNDCGHHFADNLVKPTGTHVAGELFSEEVKATCTEDGKEAAYICTTCGKECDIEGGTVDVLPKGDGTHNIDGLEPVKVVDGVEYYVCADCGAEVKITVACPEGEHVWSDAPVAIVVPTQEADGTATYECTKCGVTKTIVFVWTHDCAEHLVHVEAVVPKHCEDEGNIEYWYCELCGTKYADEDATTVVTEVENNGKHSFDNDPTYIAPTCTGFGFTFYACTICGEHDATKTIVHKPLGHKAPEDVEVTNATCEKPGYTGDYVCTVCEKDVAGEEVPATGHNYVKVEVAATCSNFAYTYEYCTNENCDHEAVEKVNGYNVTVKDADGNAVAVNYKPDSLVVDEEGGLDADNHALIEQIIVEPTCTTAGSKYYYCPNCNYDTNPEIVPATGHNYDLEKGAYIVKTHSEQSCDDDYVVDIHCANCDTVKEEVTLAKALGHDTAESELLTKHPTCKVDGKTYKICARCGGEVTVETLKFNFDLEKYYDTVDDALVDHAGLITADGYHEIDRTGSCEMVGLYRYHCADCGKAVLIKIDGTGNGHIADDNGVKNAVEGDCETDGYTGDFHCRVCDKDITGTVIKATGHKPEDVASKAPTCTADGFTAGKVCSVCEEVLEAQEIIPATGHNYVADEEGNYVCQVCEDVCDHSGKVLVDSRDADCTLYGYAHYSCDCGYEYAIDYVAEKGHVEDEGTTTDATCTENGKTVYTCTVCGEVVRTEVIVAEGHKNAAGETIVESCVDTVEDRFCVVCETEVSKDCAEENLDKVLVPATCGEYGYYLVVCTLCGTHTMVVDDTLEPTEDHTWVLAEITTAPTVTTPGVGKYVCSVCGKTKIDVVDFTGTAFGITVDNALVAGADIVKGSQIKVTVAVNTEEIAVWGLDLDINYSGALLTFDKAVVSETFANATGKFGTTVVSNTNKVSILATANNTVDKDMQDATIEGEVVVVELYFTVKAEGTITLGGAGTMMDKVGDIVLTGTASATVTAGKMLDIDADGDIDLTDLNLIMQYYTGDFAKEVDETYEAAADYNFNGTIDVEDVKALMTVLLKD